ncbi:MAG: hypothetical protein MUO30_03865 [Anaerolineales bacterium]|nr:hypothetical protein [Anaerolineales bacterium]
MRKVTIVIAGAQKAGTTSLLIMADRQNQWMWIAASAKLINFMLGVWPYDRRILKGVVAAGVTIIVLLVLNLFSFEYALLHLGIAIVLSFGVFAGILLSLGLVAEDREFLRTLQL